MTDKRFTVKNIMFDGDCIVDNTDGGYYTTDKQDLINLCETLNELHEEKEFWKSMCCSQSNFNQILLNELDFAQEQGYEVSNPFEKLMEKKERLEE